MAKTAQLAVPQGDQKIAEGKKSGFAENPHHTAPRVEARSLRGTFAKSICSAHGLATLKDRDACDDGVPCAKLSECMGQADATIRYLELRKRLMEDD
ncbi:hypothetical protein [Magnetovibrio sp.]|uniref:hypothetical protein n=1 Tax=Magnetovibrio sp. TaxID=2024836 RepID=UPI002F93213F